MRSKSLLLAAALLLSGCAPSMSLFGSHAQKPVAVPAPAKPTCPGALSADLQPQPIRDPKAGIAEPQTDGQKAAFALYLDWLAKVGTWSRAGWDRAAIAKDWCSR